MAPERSNAWKSWYLHDRDTMSHGARPFTAVEEL